MTEMLSLGRHLESKISDQIEILDYNFMGI